MGSKQKAIQTLNSLRQNNELMKSLSQPESGVEKMSSRTSSGTSSPSNVYCGHCKNYQDMPKFGGLGKIKQGCLTLRSKSISLQQKKTTQKKKVSQKKKKKKKKKKKS